MAFQDRHLQRVSFRGPVSGGYSHFVFTVPGTALTIDPSFTIKVPFACKVMEVSDVATANTGATFTVSTTAGALITTRAIATTAETVGPDPAAAANFGTDANRVMAKGDILTVSIAHGTSFANACIVVTVRSTDHVIKKATTNVGDDSSVESLD